MVTALTNGFGIKAHSGLDGYLLVALVTICGVAGVRIAALGALHHPAELRRVLPATRGTSGIAFRVVGAIAFLTGNGIANVTMSMTLAGPALLA